MSSLEILNLCKTYKGKRGVVVNALRDLNLSVAPGEVFGFLGPNGAGKSTTIKILVGLVSPTQGSATICGRPVSVPSARHSTGYLPENPSFFDFLTGREYLAFVGKAFAMDSDRLAMETERILKVVDLEHASGRPIKSYSKGMVQRLGLAQALLHDPDIYILDEPMSGLDPVGRALVKEIILHLKARGKTVFFSTHITADVEAVCDRVGIIVKGRLQTVERVGDVLRSGVEGYMVHLVSPLRAAVAEKWAAESGGDGVSYFVPTERLTEIMSLINAEGVAVSLIEPRRKDLEKFFLDIVRKGSE